MILGTQTPRISSVPAYSGSSGLEAVELAAMAGLELDPWQQLVLRESLGEIDDGSWAAFEVCLVCPRQNGKNAILEARELAGLFLLGERLLIHSAHQFDTSIEAYRRLKSLVENTPDLDRRVRRYMNSHGEEGIELRNGQRIRFRTRTKGGGRGFSGDCVIFDEAMIFPEASLAAILPIVSARPNPQVWYTGSAVDRLIHDDGRVLARLRDRGIKGADPSLAYFEWSLDLPNPDGVPEEVARDRAAWAQANPAYGIRVNGDYIEGERRSLGQRSFAVERLGVGDWPALDGSEGVVIDPDDWDNLADEASLLADPVCFAFDVSPDRSSAAICAAGKRRDGLGHVEVIRHDRGTGWVVPRLLELHSAGHAAVGFVCDGAGPAASLLPQLEQAGVEVTTVSAKEHGNACGLLFDAVEQQTLRHLGTHELGSAVRGATSRPLGDAWAWSRKNSNADICPLVAATLAFWGSGALSKKPKAAPRVIDLSTV